MKVQHCFLLAVVISLTFLALSLLLVGLIISSGHVAINHECIITSENIPQSVICYDENQGYMNGTLIGNEHDSPYTVGMMVLATHADVYHYRSYSKPRCYLWQDDCFSLLGINVCDESNTTIWTYNFPQNGTMYCYANGNVIEGYAIGIILFGIASITSIIIVFMITIEFKRKIRDTIVKRYCFWMKWLRSSPISPLPDS